MSQTPVYSPQEVEVPYLKKAITIRRAQSKKLEPWNHMHIERRDQTHTRHVYNTWYPARYDRIAWEEICATEEDVKTLRLFQYHLHILAKREHATREYLERYFSHIMQYPWIKIDIILTFYSQKEGVGKGLLRQLLENLFGSERVKSTGKPEDFFGKFNAAISCLSIM